MAQKIVVASGKGGVGKSSVTAGLCRALADAGKRVLAVDGDVGLRSLDIIFNVSKQAVFDWGDIVRNICEPQKAVVDCGGIKLLTAPLKFHPEITEKSASEMIKNFEDDFDYIIIDAPAGINQGFRAAAAMADRGLIVATPDEVCVRSAAVAGAELDELGIKNVRMIINRFDKKATEKCFFLNIDDVIDSACVRLIGIVPENRQLLYNFTRGKTLSKKNAAYKAFRRIAKRIDGENIPLLLP